MLARDNDDDKETAVRAVDDAEFSEDSEMAGTGVVEAELEFEGEREGDTPDENDPLDVAESFPTICEIVVDGEALIAEDTLVDGESLLGGETLGE